MKKQILAIAFALIGSIVANAQQQSSATIEGKAISVKYAAPTGTSRVVASFNTEADLEFKGMTVPKGEYTMYVLADAPQWQLAVNKAIGAKAAMYNPKLDLGRVPLTMGKAGGAVVPCKLTLTKTAALAARLEVAWNGTVASSTFHLDRGATDSEW